MKYLILTLFFSLIGLPGISQSEKFGKITDEQWKIKDCSFDTSAKSLILFDVGDMAVQTVEGVNNKDPECRLGDEFFTLSYERHFRIKVLSDNGLNSDFITICLRSLNGKKDRLTSFQGLVLNMVNEKTEKVKFGERDLKKIINQDGSSEMVLELSGLKKGSIIDIKYLIETNILNELPYWDFSSNYPVLYSEVTYSVPDFYSVNKNCSIINALTYKSFDRNAEYGVSYQLSDGWKYYEYSFTVPHEEYSLRNVPADYKSDKIFRLTYSVNSVGYDLVTCKKGSFIKQ